MFSWLFRKPQSNGGAQPTNTLVGTGSDATRNGLKHVATMPDGRKIFTNARVDEKRTTATKLVFKGGSSIEGDTFNLNGIKLLIETASGGLASFGGSHMKNSTFKIS